MSDQEIHVEDLGTTYKVPTYDKTTNFDPSSASVKQIRFRMPGVSDLVVRDATAAQFENKDGDTVWGLTYTVDPDEANDVAEFHVAAGRIVMQGFIQMSDGRKWSSNKLETDEDGRVLKVHPNL